MKINVDNPAQLLSHVMLQNRSVVDAVVATEEWKENGTVTATVSFNGVEVPAEALEEVLQHFVDIIKKSCEYEEVESRIRDRAAKSKRIEENNVSELRESLNQMGWLLENLEDNLNEN